MGLIDKLNERAAASAAAADEKAEMRLNALSVASVFKGMQKADRMALAPNAKGQNMAVVEAINANTKATLLLLEELRGRRAE